MIRSQIPLSLPPVPPAHKKSGSALGRGGRPAVVNGPAVRVHLGGGGVRGVDYRSLRLQKHIPLSPLFPRRERSSRWITFVLLSYRRFPKDVINLMFRDCRRFRKQERRGKGILRDPAGHEVPEISGNFNRKSKKLYYAAAFTNAFIFNASYGLQSTSLLASFKTQILCVLITWFCLQAVSFPSLSQQQV